MPDFRRIHSHYPTCCLNSTSGCDSTVLSLVGCAQRWRWHPKSILDYTSILPFMENDSLKVTPWRRTNLRGRERETDTQWEAETERDGEGWTDMQRQTKTETDLQWRRYAPRGRYWLLRTLIFLSHNIIHIMWITSRPFLIGIMHTLLTLLW